MIRSAGLAGFPVIAAECMVLRTNVSGGVAVAPVSLADDAVHRAVTFGGRGVGTRVQPDADFAPCGCERSRSGSLCMLGGECTRSFSSDGA